MDFNLTFEGVPVRDEEGIRVQGGNGIAVGSTSSDSVTGHVFVNAASAAGPGPPANSDVLNVPLDLAGLEDTTQKSEDLVTLPSVPMMTREDAVVASVNLDTNLKETKSTPGQVVEIAAQVPASFENLNLPVLRDEKGNKMPVNEVEVEAIEPTLTLSDLSSLSGTSAAIDNIAPQAGTKSNQMVGKIEQPPSSEFILTATKSDLTANPIAMEIAMIPDGGQGSPGSTPISCMVSSSVLSTDPMVDPSTVGAFGMVDSNGSTLPIQNQIPVQSMVEVVGGITTDVQGVLTLTPGPPTQTPLPLGMITSTISEPTGPVGMTGAPQVCSSLPQPPGVQQMPESELPPPSQTTTILTPLANPTLELSADTNSPAIEQNASRNTTTANLNGEASAIGAINLARDIVVENNIGTDGRVTTSGAIPVCVIASTNSAVNSSGLSAAIPFRTVRMHNLPPKKAKYDLSMFAQEESPSEMVVGRSVVSNTNQAPLPLIKQERYRSMPIPASIVTSVISNSVSSHLNHNSQTHPSNLIQVQVVKPPSTLTFGNVALNNNSPPAVIVGAGRGGRGSHPASQSFSLPMGASIQGGGFQPMATLFHPNVLQTGQVSIPSSVPVSVVTSLADRLNKGKTSGGSKGGAMASSTHPSQNGLSAVSGGGKISLAPLLSGDPAKPFQCSICGKKLASKNVYQLHFRSHTGERPFSCSLCQRSFSQKTSLTRHMRSHTGDRPYPCEVCGKRFGDKERIKIHMRTHTGEKPFSCGVCNKAFSQKSTVKRHLTVHTGEKPWKCDHCGKGFANRGNLTAHKKTHSTS